MDRLHELSLKLRDMSLDEKGISELKGILYKKYDLLLNKGAELIKTLPSFSCSDNLLFWSGPIKDDKVFGRDYLLGDVVSKDMIDKKHELFGYVVDTKNGIELFEHYSRRSFRPIVWAEDGIVVDLTEMKKEKHKEELRGKSVDEVIRLNFKMFPEMHSEFLRLPKEKYMARYLEKRAQFPIFY